MSIPCIIWWFGIEIILRGKEKKPENQKMWEKSISKDKFSFPKAWVSLFVLFFTKEATIFKMSPSLAKPSGKGL